MENFKVYPFFPEKWFFIRRPNWAFSSLVLKIWFRLLTHLQTNLNETAIWEENCRYVSNIASMSQKNGFVFVDKIFLFEAFCQYLTTHNIRVRQMADFKTSLHETPIWREPFMKDSRFGSLPQKKVLYSSRKLHTFYLFNQYSVTKTIRHNLSEILKHVFR